MAYETRQKGNIPNNIVVVQLVHNFDVESEPSPVLASDFGSIKASHLSLVILLA